jgi:hypothetical protein
MGVPHFLQSEYFPYAAVELIPATAGTDREAANARACAEAAAAVPANRDPVAVEAGRALERRLQAGMSPTGTERRS